MWVILIMTGNIFENARVGGVLGATNGLQARIQGMGARVGAHPWDGISPFKIHYSIAFEHQFITGRPPLGEILYPPLGSQLHFCVSS